MNNEQRDEKIIETHTAVMVMVEKFDNVNSRVEGLEKTAYDKENGTVIEVDRLKVFKTQSRWFFGAICLGAIGLVFRLIYSHLTK